MLVAAPPESLGSAVWSNRIGKAIGAAMLELIDSKSLFNLRERNIAGTKAIASGIAKWKQALPNCKVIGADQRVRRGSPFPAADLDRRGESSVSPCRPEIH